MRGPRKEQRSVALPGVYWAEIDALAHQQHQRPAVFAANLLRGALERVRAGNAIRKLDAEPPEQALLFDDVQGNHGGFGNPGNGGG